MAKYICADKWWLLGQMAKIVRELEEDITNNRKKSIFEKSNELSGIALALADIYKA